MVHTGELGQVPGFIGEFGKVDWSIIRLVRHLEVGWRGGGGQGPGDTCGSSEAFKNSRGKTTCHAVGARQPSPKIFRKI